MRLHELQRAVGERGFYYPPVPTYQDAMLGGSVSTNAGGAATFKYGVTRHWVEGLRVVLFNGDVLELERGRAVVRAGEEFRIRLSDGRELSVPAPRYRLPELKKISAGYFASDPLDLVDLFVGAEGTLGLLTEVTVRLLPRPPAVIELLAFTNLPEVALAIATSLREAAVRSRRDPAWPDVRAIELLDASSLELLRVHGDTRRLRVVVPEGARSALLLEVELPSVASRAEVEEAVAAAWERRPPGRSPLVHLFGILAEHGALDDAEIAFPGDETRRDALLEFRESVPKRVNEILSGRRRTAPGVGKVGGDLIVPFDQVGEMLRIYEEGFRRRGLEWAVWGHLSDGNLHPNAIPRDAHETSLGIDAQREFAEEAIRRGGCPLSEHGVGRSLLKQELLRKFLGEEAVESMRRIKRALDPEGRFAPGVIFPEST